MERYILAKIFFFHKHEYKQKKSFHISIGDKNIFFHEHETLVLITKNFSDFHEFHILIYI